MHLGFCHQAGVHEATCRGKCQTGMLQQGHYLRTYSWQRTFLKKAPSRITYAAPVVLSKLTRGALMRKGSQPQETLYSYTEACRKMSVLSHDTAAAVSQVRLTVRTVT